QLPVVVACLDESAPGREVLHAARAGAEHFAFRHVDDFPSVLHALVATSETNSMQEPLTGVDDIGRARARAELRRAPRRNRYAERAPAAVLGMLPPSVS